MARKFCCYLPNAPLSDCSSHRHLSRREVFEQEQQGRIVRLDISGTRFIETGPLGLEGSRVYKTLTHPQVTAGTVTTSVAGIAGAKALAKKRVEEFGARTVAIPGLTFDSEDVWIQTPRGEPVRALLKRRDAKVAARVERYFSLQWPKRSTGEASLTDLDAVLRKRRIELAKAARLLLAIWPKVLVQFWAGDFSAPMNRMATNILPPGVVYWTLRAYLS